ncbi:MAG: amino acid permease [Chryseolinea sp.]
MTKVHKFGTFGGVFTPSLLTILGVIMYMRLPMIVGQAGLWVTIGIIVLAHLISVTTGLSISSIATDKKVEAGGSYYMISRSLGLPIGGTLGLALFAGLSLSVSLYLIGFSESLLSYLGYETNTNAIRFVGTIVLIAVTTITIVSTSLAIKAQYIIMATMVLSLISILIGEHEFAAPANEFVAPSSDNMVPFMVLFGIFFPAVTGFEAGVSMSGDLKDPKGSIPLGSITAIVVGLFVYLGLAVFLALTVDSKMLSSDPQVLLKVSWLPGWVIAGIWGATLSSALGSILGAPRILQATAVDKITPRFFARGVGASNEPRNALILTFLIAETGILIGDLNVIARVVSIFFITTYGFINLSCAFETWTSADFRPTFKTPGWISLLGAVACFIVMIELDFIATVAASVILGLLFFYLKRKELSLQSGDAWSGVWSSLAKTSLFRLTGAKEHTRNWRPNILMFNGADEARPYMIQLGYAIGGKLGLLSSFELVQADVTKLTRLERDKKPSNRSEKMFHHTYFCEDIYSGIDEIIRVYGFPGVEPNTVLMGWTNRAENKDKFVALMKRIQEYNFSSLFLHHNNLGDLNGNSSIDIWWSGRGSNLSLALNILRHLTLSDLWKKSSIRICTILNNSDDNSKVERFLRSILAESRITATIRIIDNSLTLQGEQDIIGKESAGTALTIIGMQNIISGSLETTFRNIQNICGHLRSALFIHASDAFEEYNVIEATTSAETLKSAEWILPPLEGSRYSEIDVDIEKIDNHGKDLVIALYNKVFRPCFRLDDELYDKTFSLARATAHSIRKISSLKPSQRPEAVENARKHFLKQADEFVSYSLAISTYNQTALIAEGLIWYLQQIESDVNRFPKSKYIRHERREFAVQKFDRFALRWFKVKQRVLRPFSNRPIPIKITFRNGASYFFRDTRYHFLTMITEDVHRILSASRERLHNYLAWADESFHSVITRRQDQFAVSDFARQLEDRAQRLVTPHQDSMSRCLGRLQVEYRKNVNFFMHQIEHLEFNWTIRKKRRTRKFYLKKKKLLNSFSAEWQEKAVLDLNSLKTNIMIRQYYGAAALEVDQFRAKIAQFFDNQKNGISETKEALSKILVFRAGDFKQAALPELNKHLNYLDECVQEMSEQLLVLTGDVAEQITINVPDHRKDRIYRLPLQAMIKHLVETTLSAPFETKVAAVSKEVKRVSFVITDRAKLSMFNAFNLQHEDARGILEEEVKTALDSIQEESETLDQIADSILNDINEHLNRLKQSLNIHELTGMSGDFSQLLRLRKTRQFRTRVTRRIFGTAGVLKTAFISALYSRTKGILLAQQLSSETQMLSVNERILEQVVRATPKSDILLKLPHYYVSLFNRRSSIGDNFWIPKAVEEQELEKVYDRYRSSGKGMILVIGEPNAGKSALCKHFAIEKGDLYTPYHIFPPDDGSISISTLEEVLRKATGIQGDSELLLGMLPENSMIILHDLELWWERSEPNGLDVIRHIKWMIEEFSDRYLFVVNTTPFSFSIINTAEPLDILCAGIVRCLPFNSFELKQLIMTRHNSSGLSLEFIRNPEGASNEIKMARVFNRLFSHSNGNPGAAMNAWLAGIQDYSNKMIMWKKPSSFDGRTIREMPEIWGHFCFQLLIHNRMSLDKMVRCLEMEREQIVEIITIMERLYLITECTTSVYCLNSNMESLLVAYCKEKEWVC